MFVILPSPSGQGGIDEPIRNSNLYKPKNRKTEKYPTEKVLAINNLNAPCPTFSVSRFVCFSVSQSIDPSQFKLLKKSIPNSIKRNDTWAIHCSISRMF
jgi:hypothetical protein